MRERRLLVMWSGNHWDGLPATDHHLARSLTRHCDVLWVDPAQSAFGGRPMTAPVLRTPIDGLRVLDLPALPAHSRPGVRRATRLMEQAAVRSFVARERRPVWATLVSSPRATFLPRRVAGVRLLHVTDDWLAGAPLMGLDAEWLREMLLANLRRADVVSAVSPHLVDVLAGMSHRHDIELVPNGVELPAMAGVDDAGPRGAVLLGQLNERLDFGCLQAVVDAGVPLRLVGPRTARDSRTLAAFEKLVSSSHVEWLGAVEPGRVPALLAQASVGLTPYSLDDFNQSSFPLKTLEYLAAGLPVVSTRLDSLPVLHTDLVDVADDPVEFASLVASRAKQRWQPDQAQARRQLAAGHSWEERAERLVALAQRISG